MWNLKNVFKKSAIREIKNLGEPTNMCLAHMIRKHTVSRTFQETIQSSNLRSELHLLGMSFELGPETAAQAHIHRGFILLRNGRT